MSAHHVYVSRGVDCNVITVKRHRHARQDRIAPVGQRPLGAPAKSRIGGRLLQVGNRGLRTLVITGKLGMVAFLSGTVDDGCRRTEVVFEVSRAIIVPAHDGMSMLKVVLRIGIADRRSSLDVDGGTDIIGEHA